MKPYGPPRPLRSQGVPTLRGLVLSDARIFAYMLKGFYGPEQKAIAEREVAEAKPHKRTPVLTASDILSSLL